MDSQTRIRSVNGTVGTTARRVVLHANDGFDVGHRWSERLALLHAREERVPVPLAGAIDEARPRVDFDLGRPDVVHTVHSGRAAEDLAAGPRDGAVARVGLADGRVRPVVGGSGKAVVVCVDGGVCKRCVSLSSGELRCRPRTDGVGGTVTGVASLEHEDGGVGIFRKTRSDGESGSASTYDDEVVRVRDLAIVDDIPSPEVLAVVVVIYVAVTASKRRSVFVERSSQEQKTPGPHRQKKKEEG